MAELFAAHLTLSHFVHFHFCVLILQVTGDHGHYDGVVAELEARGAKVVPVFAGAWRAVELIFGSR